jgi:hypothetical protein
MSRPRYGDSYVITAVSFLKHSGSGALRSTKRQRTTSRRSCDDLGLNDPRQRDFSDNDDNLLSRRLKEAVDPPSGRSRLPVTVSLLTIIFSDATDVSNNPCYQRSDDTTTGFVPPPALGSTVLSPHLRRRPIRYQVPRSGEKSGTFEILSSLTCLNR